MSNTRIIKYRVKRNSDGEWIYGRPPTIFSMLPENDSPNLNTLCEYTSAKDKNGQELYGGDIIMRLDYFGNPELFLVYQIGHTPLFMAAGIDIQKAYVLTDIVHECALIGNEFDSSFASTEEY